MIDLFKPRDANLPRTHARGLGSLEVGVMEVLWSRGAGNVRDVAEGLGRPLAYTTVMTTLDRLFKKGLLVRHKAERAFVYAPRLNRQQWERKRAGDFLAGFLAAPRARDLLISCLIEAVGEQDEALLDELELQLRQRRKQLLHRDST